MNDLREPWEEEFLTNLTITSNPNESVDGWPGHEELDARLSDLAKSDTDVRWELGNWLLVGESHYAKRDSESKWEIGDALANGEQHYPTGGGEVVAGYWLPVYDMYSVAETVTGLARRTLIDLASTAKRCPKVVRTDKLTWSHHRVLVNARPEADDETLKTELKRAVDEKLSVAGFREELKGRKKSVARVKTFLVTVPLNVFNCLKNIADGEGSAVRVVAAELLSGCVASEEGVLRREVSERRIKERRLKQQQKNGRRLQKTHPGKHFGST
jgi:hypothetical protein